MKFLIVLLVILFGVWLWRSRRVPPPSTPKPPKDTKPQGAAEMVRCAVCGLHLPQADAQITPRGVYCSVEHRQQIER
jgi:uncharacterized protein